MDTIRTASRIVRLVQTKYVHDALTKEDRSPVTVADYASQAIVNRLLQDQFPMDPLIAEETAEALRAPSERGTLETVTAIVKESEPEATPDRVCEWIDIGDKWWVSNGSKEASPKRYWTLDPIDGTKGFLRGDQYVVALAYIEGGEVQIGALGCPNLSEASQPDSSGVGSLIIAVRGSGTWMSPLFREGEFKRMQVSDCQEAAAARLLQSFESTHTNVSQMRLFSQELGMKTEPIRMDSQAKYALLASGHGELYLRMLNPDKPDYREKIWDQAAGSLIIEEAGGRVTDLFGNGLDFSTGASLVKTQGVFASNGHLHDVGLNILSMLLK